MKKSAKKQFVHYDAKSDVLYFGVKRGAEEEFVEIAPGIVAELDGEGLVIGVEVLNASGVFRPVAKSIELRAMSTAR
ncbi:MAG: DUF2283 domain-containing protein [Nanoarchaeota archaeon]|nr:DUF2283 domain-containing protein [Nanoarchaeota archaeon]